MPAQDSVTGHDTTAARAALLDAIHVLRETPGAPVSDGAAWDDVNAAIDDLEETLHEAHHDPANLAEIGAFATAASALAPLTIPMRAAAIHALDVFMLPQTPPTPLLDRLITPATAQVLVSLLPGLLERMRTQPIVETPDAAAPARANSGPGGWIAGITRGEPGHLWLVRTDGTRVEIDAETAEKLGFPLA